MYGVFASVGACGGLTGLTLGKFLLGMTSMRSINLVSVALVAVFIAVIWWSKISEDKQFERPMRFKNRISYTIQSEEL